MNPRPPRLGRPTVLLLTLALAAVRCFAGEPAPYTGPLWAYLDSASVLRAAAGITLARYADCDAVTVDEKVVESYRPDGTADCQDESYTKVLTEKGRQENDVLSLYYLLPYFTVRVVRIEIVKPGGATVPVNVEANESESIDDSQMQENIYDPDSRILRVNIPGLEIGDVVHAIVRTTTGRPIMPGQFADLLLLEGPEYLRHTTCEIVAPASRPLLHALLRDPVAGSVSETTRPGPDGTTVYDWEAGGVPRMYDEPAMPPYESVLQRVLASTIPDWAAVSRWYWRLSEPHLAATSPAMAAAVSRLTAGARTDREKIEALFYYVSRAIRYVGVTPEKDRPGFEPHDVRLTFEKRYGVCRDKAALLVAMLRMAGEPAYPVLINVGTKLDPDAPMVEFNHAIVAVELGKGRYLLMDPTDEHTRVLLPAYDDNQSYLVCRPEGDALRTSPVTPAEANLMRIRTTGVLGPDGGLTATAVLAFGGANDDAYRGAFVEMKPDDRRRFFEHCLQRALPGARLTSLRISPANLLDQSSPLTAEIGFSADGLAAFGARQAIVRIPWLGRSLGIVNFVLDGTGLARRKYPMLIDATCGIDEEVSLRLGSAFGAAVSLPSDTSLDFGCARYGRRFALRDRTLDCAEDLRLETVEFSPAQYLQLKEVLKDYAHDERKALVAAIAAPPPPPAASAAERRAGPEVGSDAEVLEDRQELDVKDAHTATLTVEYAKRILSYAGKVRESEISIPFDPATETVRLVSAFVVSPSGRREEASPDELNLMDAGWDASAKRYTPGKVLVDSLPGVEVGSVIHVEYEILGHDLPYVAGFEPFQLQDRLDRKSFRIAAPPGLAVETRVSGPPGMLAFEKGSGPAGRTLAWTAGTVAPLANERGLPPPWSFQPGVAYFVGDPSACLSRIDAAMADRARASAAAGALARRLDAGARTRLDAATLIRDYVAKNIRLAGPTFTDLPLSQLSGADVTLAEGYGDAADRAILLYAMLSAAGFRPQFILASDLPPVPHLTRIVQSFPLLEAFSDPLVRVSIGGNAYYLNDTDQYARLGSTAHDDRLGIALATGACGPIRALPGYHNRVTTLYSVSLADDGDALIHVRREYYGMAYADPNRRFSELRPEERALFYQEEVSQVAQGARPVGPLATDFDAYPGVEQFAVEVDRYGVADGRFFYFDLPFAPRLLPTETDRRSLPLFATEDDDATIRAEIALPSGYRRVVIAPRPAAFTEPDGAGSAQIVPGAEPGRWTITYRLDSRPAIIPAADYPAALAVESAVENKASLEILLEGPSPARPASP